MKNRNPANERIKHNYFEYLKHADGKSEQTIRQVEKALFRFEESTRFSDFKSFDQKQATAFKASLIEQGLALPTTLSTLNNLKRFLAWLTLQVGYKRSISISDIEYLNLPENDKRAASAPVDKKFPTLRMIERVIKKMPFETSIQKRDRALLAFIAITGIRDGAIISLQLKHFDIDRRLVLQNPIEVKTKFGKRIDTFLFPISEAFEQIVLDWVDYLKQELLFAEHEPLFPKTKMGHDENNCFLATGLTREQWADAAPARSIFKAAFGAAKLPSHGPHSFRNMIVSEMYARKLSVAECKAWSQNLGHEGAMTTLTSYGKLSLEEQGRLVREAGQPDSDPITRADLEKILRERKA